MNLLFRRLGPAFQHPCGPNPTSARPLVQACHCSPSSHTQWNIVKPPRVPRDAVFNSRSQSRAMLDCVERKNAISRNSSFCGKSVSPAVRSKTIKEKSVFSAVFVFDCRMNVFDRTFSVFLYCFFFRRLFYPDSAIKWPGRIGVPQIPENKIQKTRLETRSQKAKFVVPDWNWCLALGAISLGVESLVTRNLRSPFLAGPLKSGARRATISVEKGKLFAHVFLCFGPASSKFKLRQ